MRKIVAALVIGLSGLALNPVLAQAELYDNLVQLPLDQNQAQVLEAAQTEDSSWAGTGEVLGTTALVGSDELLDVGPHFFYGEEQMLNEDLTGDVYVIAGKVEINGNIDGDLMVLGGTVILNGDVSQDVRAAAGTIQINGLIGQNLTVGAGQVFFGEQARVGNSVVAGGGDVSLNGQTMGKVLLGGGAAKLAGQYGSDVHAQADTFKVMPGVVVNGSLIADAYTSAEVADDAQVMQETMVKVIPPEEHKQIQSGRMQPVGGVLVKMALFDFLLKMLIGLVSGSLLIYFFPKLVKAVKSQVLAAPLGNFGWGLVYLFMTPVVICLALISIVAMPVAGLISLVFLGTMMVAKTLVAMALGDKLAANLKLKAFKNPYLSFAFGLLVLQLISFMPILGWIIGFAAFVMGLGAIFTLMKNYLGERKK